LDGSKLSLKGGVDNGEVFSVYIKVRASAINSDGFEYTNPKDGYKDLELTIMMTDDDYIKTQSSKILESKDSETSISIIEDNPGDILLDLSDFKDDLNAGMYFLNCTIGSYKETMRVVVY